MSKRIVKTNEANGKIPVNWIAEGVKAGLVTLSADDIEKIPDGYEIYENADGLVFCRKKFDSNILPSEVECLKAWKRRLEEKHQARVFIDVKKDEVVVSSCVPPAVSLEDAQQVVA